MSASSTAPASAAARREAADREAAGLWWVFLIIGVLWLVFALLIFRADAKTVNGIAYLAGAVCMAGALIELVAAAADRGGWRIVRILLAIAFIVIGTLAFIHPEDTFSALAAIFAFYLLLNGIFAIAQGMVNRGSDFWWLKIAIGLAEVLLAFWAAGNFGHKAILLVVWIGASALGAGLAQIAHAFELRSRAASG